MKTGLRTLIAPLALALTFFAVTGPVEARKFLDAIGDADRAILKDLYDGSITYAEPFGAEQNTGALWKVKVVNQGRERWAIFKPRTPGDRDGWARSPMEAAVYKLNRILGLDVVPPTAYRRGLNLNGQYFHEGALMIWINDVHNWQKVPKREMKPQLEAFSSDVRVLQVIGRDADHENPKNIIRGQHWKDGTYRIMKVDNEAFGRAVARVELEYTSASWGPVTRFNKATFERLKELNFQDLKGDVGEFLSDDEIRGWLAARDKLVTQIEAQVKQRGAEKVFFSEKEIAFDSRKRTVGKAASASALKKFVERMAKKGVRVEVLEPGDKRIGSSAGRTVLRSDGITVRLARNAGSTTSQAALLEEAVHANQLLRMAKQAGGLRELRTLLGKKGQDAKAIAASMEEYAKGKVALVAKKSGDVKEANRLTASAKRFGVKAARTSGKPTNTRTLWSKTASK